MSSSIKAVLENVIVYFQENVTAKKPMLKLASFADLGQNGISDSIPVTCEEVNKCGQCSKRVHDLDNPLMWEAMLFCNINCLGKNLDDKSKGKSSKRLNLYVSVYFGFLLPRYLD